MAAGPRRKLPLKARRRVGVEQVARGPSPEGPRQQPAPKGIFGHSLPAVCHLVVDRLPGHLERPRAYFPGIVAAYGTAEGKP